MADTGHSKNIIAFDNVISVCESLGTDYNPSKVSIKLAKLKTQHTDVDTDDKTYKSKFRLNSDDKNLRKTEFAPVKKLSTKILNAIKATDASDATIEDAEGYVRKLRGERADDPPKKSAAESATGDDDNSHSVSQQSYSNIVEHLKGLIAVAKNEATYNPNETELKTATVDTLIARLTLLNKNESISFVAMENARISRDQTPLCRKNWCFRHSRRHKRICKISFWSKQPPIKTANKHKIQ
jgi:hypothetical protein